MLSRPWIHPVDLNTGPLDWESKATRPLLHERNYVIVLENKGLLSARSNQLG